jgi:hypothetical protein
MADRNALAWAIAVALGLVLCALGCEGPGLEPPYMSRARDAGAAPAAGTGAHGGGSGGKGGSGGSAGKPPQVSDASMPMSGSGGSGAELEDGGSDEDAGTR